MKHFVINNPYWRGNVHHEKDNDAPNSMYKDNTEEVYRKYVEKQNETIKWFEDCDEDGEGFGPEDAYTWLVKPIEEKLKAPDSDFATDGCHKSMNPFLIMSKANQREWYKHAHKGSACGAFRVRVPSMKRSKQEWSKFYNEFPDIAAEVRLGNRRFYNGAKLKYIW